MKSLDGLSVLLLEDEYLIALDVEQILLNLGVRKIEIVNTLASAAKIAEEGAVDLAILDLNINGEMSFGVAAKFRKRQIPIVFATGYEVGRRSDPELENAVYLTKPYTSEGLKEAFFTALCKTETAS